MSLVLHTPLLDVHHALGATMTDFAGWQMPLKYTSDVAEHHAVRERGGIFDLSHMGQIHVKGEDAAAALDFALAGHPSAMRLGQARYSMLLSPEGGILDDVVVYRIAEDEFLVVANAANVSVVHAAVESRASGFAASVTDASREWALIAVQGPIAERVVSAAAGRELCDVPYYSILPASIAGHDVLLARTGYTGEDGFEIYSQSGDAATLWAVLTVSGGPHGLVPAGLAARDSLRMEAAMPLYGHELSSELTPYDVGLGRIVSLDKPGGFVGDMALSLVRAQGVHKRLVGLACSGRRSPRSGQHVSDPATGALLGRVTSGMPSPTLGHPIAMAIIDDHDLEIGTEVQVDVRGRPEPAQVVRTPFYKRSRITT